MNRQQLLEECHNAFRQTESARILTLYRSRDNRLSFDERLSITKEIEKVFYPVFLELRNINPSLTDWDLMLSVLSYEGFSVSVIAECFSVSNDAVRMRKSRLREKLPGWLYPVPGVVLYMDPYSGIGTGASAGKDKK